MRAVYIFSHSGSHFLTNADWGCHDGEHKAWLVAETENKEEAIRILPSAYRQNAKVTLIKKFANITTSENLIRLHE